MSEDPNKTVEKRQYEEVDPPRDVSIEMETRYMYKELQEDESSPYEGAQLMEIFLNAMAVGSRQGLRQPLSGERAALFNVSSLSDKNLTHIRSIAWRDTGDEEIYYNHKRTFKIAEEFANGGIRHLHQTKLGMGDNTIETLSQHVSMWRDIESELESRNLTNASE